MSKDLKKINEQVKELLQQKPDLRPYYRRAQLCWELWKKYYQLGDFGITREKWIELYKVANPETISRAVRKIQEEHPELRGDERSNDERYKKANETSNFYKNYG